jgi:hypothetical protein
VTCEAIDGDQEMPTELPLIWTAIGTRKMYSYSLLYEYNMYIRREGQKGSPTRIPRHELVNGVLRPESTTSDSVDSSA